MSICYTLTDFPVKYDIVHSSNEKEDIYMSKLRRLMNRLSHGALSSVAALALTVTATNMNRCCWFIFGQDKLPDNAKKLRKF